MTYVVVHIRSTGKVHACVITPLDVVELTAIQERIGTVEKLVFWRNEAYRLRPVVSRLGPQSICVIIGVSCKTGSKLEEDTVRNGVFVVVAVVKRIDLPPKSTVTSLIVPSQCL